MSKDRKSSSSSSDRPRIVGINQEIRLVKGGYQPERSKFSPTKPPTNPPNKGTSGKNDMAHFNRHSESG